MASRQLGLPILVVVFTNGLYLSMRHNHVRSYPDGAAKETGTFFGVSLEGQPDPAELASVFGMTGLTVHALDELEPALTAAVRSVTDGTTAVVNVHLNR